MNQKIEISPKTIIFTVLFIILLRIVWQIRELIYALFLAFIFMSALKPLVYELENKKIPRQIAAFVTLISALLFFVFTLFFILPPIIGETIVFISNIPIIIFNTFPALTDYVNTDSVIQLLPDITQNLFRFAGGIFSNLIFIISIIFFTFYFLIEDKLIEKYLSRFLKKSYVEEISRIASSLELRMGAWFWGQIILMSVIGIITYIGLVVLGVKYALSLAFLAGLLEVVPIIGPIISTIPALFVAASSSFFLGGVTLILYFIIQQLENNLVVPLVMKKTVGIHPVITLIALTVGGKLGGLMGIIIAVPAALVIETLVLEYISKTKA